MSLQLTSPAFGAGERIPARHTADDADVSVPLCIRGVPRGARSLALVVEDPDAPQGTFVHWLLWNVPAETRSLAAALKADAFVQGKNGYGRVGWGGPKPPRGDGAHRYVFRLFALDALLDTARGATRDELESAMAGHVLAQACLTGSYFRAR
jgi:Raf kinase inhibitor-like YbhB/YbcL family protein